MQLTVSSKISLAPKVCLVLCLAAFVFAPFSHAFAGSFVTPPRGSAERKAIMNALRAPVQKVLGQPVVFKVDTLNVGEGWAFLYGVPRQPSGDAVDYAKTRYQEAITDGMFDDTISALLKNDGAGWKVLAYEIGATDVPWAAWPDAFGAPIALFER